MPTHEELPEHKEPETPHEKSNEYFTIRIPRFVFTDIAFSPLLIIILIAFSFLLGMQTARLRYMQSDLAKLQAATQTQAQQANDPNQPQLGQKVDVGIGHLPVLGNSSAKVTMIEFSDFQCPFCKRFYDETFKQLKKDYVDTGKIRFAFRHEPLSIHPNAPRAAEAAECANDQDKFWNMHNALFDAYDSWINDTPDALDTKLTQIAGQAGLNTDEFAQCLSSGKHTETVNADAKDGQAVGANATPTFFINGQMLVGALPYSTFKTILDQELSK